MRFAAACALLLAASLPLGADYARAGYALAERFDPARKAWVLEALGVEYRAEPEGLRLEAPGLAPGGPLQLRLQPSLQAGYPAWVARQRREGGALWAALKPLLARLDATPAWAISLGPLPAAGPGELLLGLRQGSRFETWARLSGRWEPRPGGGLRLEPLDLVCENAGLAAAWKLLRPLARAELRRALAREASRAASRRAK